MKPAAIDGYLERATEQARRALDNLAARRGVGKESNKAAAHCVVDALSHKLHGPCSEQGVLLDWNKEEGYHNPRVVDFTGAAEEMLYPLKPGEDEPVDEAIADVFLPLPHREWVPEI